MGISFENVIGVESFNVEGEELDGIVEEAVSDLIGRSRKLAKEPGAQMTCYSFRSSWKAESLMLIVATGCDVRKVAF